MLEDLKARVFKANLALRNHGLVLFTWGNVSGLDRESRLVAIKPSGVSYDTLRAEDMVLVDLEGRVAEGALNPSTDTPTHLLLYRSFPDIGGVAHTHSSHATARAQAGLPLPCYGTTHADYFYGAVPVTRQLTPEEIRQDYELNTGRVIVESFRSLDPLAVPGALVASHAPFTWGRTPEEAVENMVVLEEAARTAALTLSQNPQVQPISQELLDKHFLRKHGEHSYYGQNKKSSK
jgi:L-ribulose-5-phosphate 4-epimerase